MTIIGLLILLMLGFIYRRLKKMPTHTDLQNAVVTLQTAINAAAARVANALSDPITVAEIADVNAATDAANAIAPE